MTTRVFPVALVLEGRPCLVVGSGTEAAQRADALFRAGAVVTVVAEQPEPELLRLAQNGHLVLERRAFVAVDLDGKWLAVLTDTDMELADRVSRAAAERRVFFSAVDQPKVSSYLHVALARAGSLVAAISTAGSAPALGRRLREELERIFDEAGLADFVDRVSRLRQQTPSASRRQVLGAAVAGVRFEGKLELPGADDPD
jgi:precorrin-2 dehydrogenase/sirohydrochlorin ferrochelatase